MKHKINAYKDGIALVKELIPSKINYSSEQKNNDEYINIASVRFNYISVREEDANYIQAQGNKVDRKIEIPFCNAISKKHLIVISEELFKIANIDDDMKNKKRFLYLEKTDL